MDGDTAIRLLTELLEDFESLQAAQIAERLSAIDGTLHPGRDLSGATYFSGGGICEVVPPPKFAAECMNGGFRPPDITILDLVDYLRRVDAGEWSRVRGEASKYLREYVEHLGRTA